MKDIKLILAMLAVVFALSSCGGDHYSNNGQDTAKNSYQVQPDSAKLDTFAAKSPDNSASGGATLIKKDTSAMRQDSSK